MQDAPSTPCAPLGDASGELRRALERCRDAGDAEAAHDVRVLTRRIDAWLRLGGWRVLRGDLRRLRHESAGVRDLDVLLALEAQPERRRALQRKRRAARKRMLAAVESPATAALLDALPLLPPAPVGRAARALRRMVRRLDDLPRETPRDLHGLRRAVRRIRYALAWLGEDVGPLPTAQDALGAVSDLLARARLLDAPVDAAVVAAARASWEVADPFLDRWR